MKEAEKIFIEDNKIHIKNFKDIRNVSIYRSHVTDKGIKIFDKDLKIQSDECVICLEKDVKLENGEYYVLVETKTGWVGHKFNYARPENTSTGNEE
ncbi:MAG: hypothetical protein PHV06_10055 [bacterium]|nr:hypothetical protein [bacterium]